MLVRYWYHRLEELELAEPSRALEGTKAHSTQVIINGSKGRKSRVYMVGCNTVKYAS